MRCSLTRVRIRPIRNKPVEGRGGTHKLPRSWIFCKSVESSSSWLDSMNSVMLRTFWNLTNLRFSTRPVSLGLLTVVAEAY